MRSELEQIAYIEQYLLGKLSNEEKKVFEQKMASDSNFKSEVEHQENLQKAIKRSALLLTLDEIHAVQFGGKQAKVWWKNIWLNIFVGLVALGGFGWLFFSGSEVPQVKQTTEIQPETPTNQVHQPQEVLFHEDTVSHNSGAEALITEQSNPAQSVVQPAKQQPIILSQKRFDMACLAPKFDTLIYTQGKALTHSYSGSKTQISLPDNLCNLPKGTQVKLLYREYRNAAQMVGSHIPMVYQEGGEEFRFNSAGMFELIPLDSTIQMKKGAGDLVDIDFELTQVIENTGYFVLEDGVWKKIGELNNTAFTGELVEEENIPVLVGKSGVTYQSIDHCYNEAAKSLHEDLYNYYYLGPHNCNFVTICDYEIKVTDGINAKLAYPGPNMVFTDPASKLKDSEEEPLVFDIKLGAGGEAQVFSLKVRVPKDNVGLYKEEPLYCVPVKRSLFKLLTQNCMECQGGPVMSVKNITRLGEDHLSKVGLVVQLDSSGTFNAPSDFPLSLKSQQLINDLKAFSTQKTIRNMLGVNRGILGDTVFSTTISGVGKYGVSMTYDEGHATSAIVYNLRMNGFGVYNCDQASRIKNSVVRSVMPQSNHITINNIAYLNLIDLSINSAFSFGTTVTYNGIGKNLLLVFTTDSRLFLVEPSEMTALARNKSHKVQAREITSDINNSNDLWELINMYQ